jgi:protein PhnA
MTQIIVKDSNGSRLSDGDSVMVIKDLKVKGSSDVLKRGTLYKNIRLTDEEEEVEVGSGKATLVLKTCFLKKA